MLELPVAQYQQLLSLLKMATQLIYSLYISSNKTWSHKLIN